MKITITLLIILLISTTCFAGMDFSMMSGNKTEKRVLFDDIHSREEIINYVRWLKRHGLYEIMDDDMYNRLKVRAKKVDVYVPKRKDISDYAVLDNEHEAVKYGSKLAKLETVDEGIINRVRRKTLSRHKGIINQHGGSVSDRYEEIKVIKTREEMIRYIDGLVRQGNIKENGVILAKHKDEIAELGVYFPHLTKQIISGKQKIVLADEIKKYSKGVFLLFGFKMPISEIEEHTILTSQIFEKHKRDLYKKYHPDHSGKDIAAAFWFKYVHSGAESLKKRKRMLQMTIDQGHTLIGDDILLPRSVQDMIWVDPEDTGLMITDDRVQKGDSAMLNGHLYIYALQYAKRIHRANYKVPEFKSMRQATVFGSYWHGDERMKKMLWKLKEELLRKAEKQSDTFVRRDLEQQSDWVFEAYRTLEDESLKGFGEKNQLNNKNVGSGVFVGVRSLWNRGNFYKGVYRP